MTCAVRTRPAGPALTLALGGLAFLVLSSYALARPATESLFLRTYTSKMLPTAWIALTFVAALAVGLYDRFAARLRILVLFRLATALSAAALVVLLLFLRLRLSGGPFLLYLWKDVYIVVLLEIFWSFANLVSATRTARWTYGFFCIMGSLGGMAGNLGGGALAGRLGTEGLLWLVLPVLGLCWVFSGVLSRLAQAEAGGAVARERRSAGDGLRVVWRSDYLLRLLLVVAVVQIVVTLVDFQYNAMLEQAYSDTDRRTAIIGKVYAAIDLGSIGLQLLTGPILRLAGVTGTLLGIPVVLGTALGLPVAAPLMGLMLAKIAGKSFDYSLFRAAKEILYIPLTYAEKTRGKAVIDMLTYRVAKGGASLLVLGIVALHPEGRRFITVLTLLLITVWLVLTASIVPRYRRKIRASRT